MFLAMTLPACSDSASPAPHLTEETEVAIAYEAALDAFVTAALAEWPRDTTPLRFEPDVSSAIAVRAAATRSPPDVIIIVEQTGLPEGQNKPISTRHWIVDPVVFVTRADEVRAVDDLLLDEETRLAIVHESEPLGQYTRFGLRKLDRWALIENRALRYPTADQLLDAVESSTADIAAVYASQLAPRAAASPAVFSRREELLVPESARRAFHLIVMTPEGVDVARWLADEARNGVLEDFGYLRDAPRSDTP